jgi:hypothetical protein
MIASPGLRASAASQAREKFDIDGQRSSNGRDRTR